MSKIKFNSFLLEVLLETTALAISVAVFGTFLLIVFTLVGATK